MSQSPFDNYDAGATPPPPSAYAPNPGYAPHGAPQYGMPQGNVYDPNVSDKLILPGFLLCFLGLGLLGVHRFYVGKVGSGIAQLLLTVTLIGLIISGPWVLIDWIMLIVGSFKDGQGRKITRWV